MRTLEMIQADIDAINAAMPRPAKVALTIKRICSFEEMNLAIDMARDQPGVSIISLTGVTDEG